MADVAAVAGPLGPRQFQDLFTCIPFSGTCTLTAAGGAETSQVLTGVSGAALGDIVLLGVVEDAEDGSLTATVNAADQVEIILANATASTITIAAGTVVRGVVLKLRDPVGFAL